ncbi:hypothetical protein PILCRDRAFT_93371 [Piloderma croceum F 1598]|uniref:Uncharacterized protein n=1 Tax=Piloderma croceum (strain F 1598) TaxID=765440 RepID=A0A0C3EXI7_PILCF|nr:hypothetical protein PILCRDRAFT_93371 [Piloderma croceum F 1598]
MPKKYKTAEEQYAARIISKRRHYTRHRAEEKAKARERWSKHQKRALVTEKDNLWEVGNLTTLTKTEGGETIREELSKLWAMHGAQDALQEQQFMSSRAHDVIHALTVAQVGWEEFRTSCEDALDDARQLWTKSESLVIQAAAVEADMDGGDMLSLFVGRNVTLFICTSNPLDIISAPLLDRCEIIQPSAPHHHLIYARSMRSLERAISASGVGEDGILPVETLIVPGSGKLKLTVSLGEVLGAHWAEIKRINLPWANRKDMEHDVSLKIYNNMQFEFVCTVNLEAAFEY